MGYGDWSRGGHPTINTPNMNRMADEGVQMTQFYAGMPMCSPSRAALLTGRNAVRSGILHVFRADGRWGMSPEEITIAELLKPLGYATACIGKWHLGNGYQYRALRQGFDYYYGIQYSNDMEPTDLYRMDEIIEQPANQNTLTKRYTEEAIRFIEQHAEKPFFVYLPYAMPHTPIHASDSFRNSSLRGLYGDVIEELDWSVGQIMKTLDRLQLSENTLMIFTSDNGPWMIKDDHGGTAGLLKGAKGDTWEGGIREPFIARWKGRLPADTVNMTIGSVIDFLPTFGVLAGCDIPGDRPIDGINLMPALEGKSVSERTLYFYREEHLRAVRKGKWKLHFGYFDPARGGYNNEDSWIVPKTPLLFNIDVDPQERFNVADKYPDIVREISTLGNQYHAEVIENHRYPDLVEYFKTR